MHIRRYLALLIMVCLILSASIPLAAPQAPSPQSKDKCPVCGMFVSKYPDWIVTVVFNDSSTLFFDGAKDFFTWYHNMPKYTPARNRGAITAITVIDYYTLKQVDARQASYVIGSDVYGPMGKELVPFGKQVDAHAFLKDHKGRMVLRFSDVTPNVLKSLE